MKNSIYSVAVMAVKELKAKKAIEIKSEDIKAEVRASVDMDDFDREFLSEFYLNSIVTTVLNMLRCYSKSRGDGVYINIDACVDIDVLDALFKNAVGDINSDVSRRDEIVKRMKAINPEQFFISLDDPTTPIQTIGDAIGLAM